MLKSTKLMVALVALAVLMVPVASALAQTTKVTEEAQLLVMKVVAGGHTVFIKNMKTGVIKKYTEIPDNVSLMVNGKAAKLSDLREGMYLQGIRMENVSESTVTEAEVAAIPSEPAPAPAAAPAAAAPAPAPAAVTSAPAELPKTASNLPLLGLIGLSFVLAGFAVGGVRRRLS